MYLLRYKRDSNRGSLRLSGERIIAVRIALTCTEVQSGGTIMWAIDFCAKRSNDCLQIAEECTDTGQRRAWLELARGWVRLSEEVVAPKGRLRLQG
jgi:hypothetical protein